MADHPVPNRRFDPVFLWGLPEMCLRGQLDEIDPSTPSFHLGGKLLPGLGLIRR